ncbi:hypothetical protein [Enterobacter cloacae]|uniref:hypothetical protein n=1 Tax=Enterobacterales TaxID=91347 RepID=UPI00325C2AD8
MCKVTFSRLRTSPKVSQFFLPIMLLGDSGKDVVYERVFEFAKGCGSVNDMVFVNIYYPRDPGLIAFFSEILYNQSKNLALSKLYVSTYNMTARLNELSLTDIEGVFSRFDDLTLFYDS